jgi:hypothetical protein
VASLAGGASVTLQVPLTERSDPGSYSDGLEYDVAQVDFRSGRRARLYAVCEVPGDEPAAHFARNGFWVLGPLPGDMADFDPQVFTNAFQEGEPPAREYTVPWGRSLVWKAPELSKVSWLDPDIIPITGRSIALDFFKWHSSSHFPHTAIHYILSGRVVSPKDRIVRAVFCPDCVKRLSLNGCKVEGEELALKKGPNDLRILYAPPIASEAQFNERNYGCYFRLSDFNGKRVQDVRFKRPPKP